VSATRLKPEQRKAVAALFVAPSVEAAAEMVGVGAETLRAWMKLRSFQRAYRKAAAEFRSVIPAGPPYCTCKSGVQFIEFNHDEPEPTSPTLCPDCGRPPGPRTITIIVKRPKEPWRGAMQDDETAAPRNL
jgi:hypothetical protein